MDRFGTVEFSESQRAAALEVREQFREVEHAIEILVQPGWKKALALTKLEEACMWAVRAIASEK
jgi:hypothetical protein